MAFDEDLIGAGTGLLPAGLDCFGFCEGLRRGYGAGFAGADGWEFVDIAEFLADARACASGKTAPLQYHGP